MRAWAQGPILPAQSGHAAFPRDARINPSVQPGQRKLRWGRVVYYCWVNLRTQLGALNFLFSTKFLLATKGIEIMMQEW